MTIDLKLFALFSELRSLHSIGKHRMSETSKIFEFIWNLNLQFGCAQSVIRECNENKNENENENENENDKFQFATVWHIRDELIP